MPDENTVSVEAGSTTVLGHLTQFVGFAGDTFNCGGMSIPVAAVVSTSELTLAYGWPSVDVVDSAAWVIMPTSAEWSSTVSLHKSVNDLLVKVRGGLPIAVNAAGPLSHRSLYDAEPEGFTFLEVTTSQDDPFRLYAKLSDTTADWSVGQTIRGDAAISTGEAIAAAALAQAWATQAVGEVEPGEGYSAKYHAAATAADRVATGQDRAATAADRVATGQDKAATAADRVATGQDKAATASDRDLAQKWATKTDGEVVAGQGRGAKYYSDQAAATLAGALRHDITQSLATANKLLARQNAGLGAAIESINSLTPVADRLAYFTGAGAAALATLTSFARSILDDTTGSAMWATMGGLGILSGYTRLPNGLILQWGNHGGGSGDFTVPFPTAFPTGVGSVVATAVNDPGATVFSGVMVDQITLTSFAMRRRNVSGGAVSDSTGFSARWIAIGN